MFVLVKLCAMLFSLTLYGNCKDIDWTGTVTLKGTYQDKWFKFPAFIYCSGILISKQWILTAAHCFNMTADINDWQVHVGEIRIIENDFICQVKNIFQKKYNLEYQNVAKINIYENYNYIEYWLHDIALVKLESEQPIIPNYIINNEQDFPDTKSKCYLKEFNSEVQIGN